MRDIPEDEARALFARPLVCADCTEWETCRLQPDSKMIEAGVTDEDGISARLLVQLIFTRSRKTKLVSYRFTVFQRQPWKMEPAYQLHVSQPPKGFKAAHAKPHEHIGTAREIGDASWASWSYDEVLTRFCAITNITFRPKPPHPEEFALKG